MLNKTSMLENYLIRGITEKRLLPGAKIPSRNALTAKFGCSRTTVERAVENLTKNGYLGSRKGSGTYVLSASPNTEIRHAYFLCEYNIFAAGWKSAEMLFHPFRAKIPVELGSPSVCEEQFDTLASAGNAVIWMMPMPEQIYFIQQLKKRGIPQFLINREYLDCDSICTDQEEGIRKGLTWLLMQCGKDISVVSPNLSFDQPYLFERLSSFFKCALEMGVSLPGERIFLREFKDIARDSAEVGSHLFDNLRRPKGICVLYQNLVLPLLTYARSRGLEPGKDFFLLMFDWYANLQGTPGIAMLRQPFEVFLAEAGNWLYESPRSAKPRHLRSPAELILP